MSFDIEKIPPHNLKAEAAVLGSMILDKEACNECISKLYAMNFYNPGNGVIFKAIYDLNSSNTPVDILTVNNLLKAEGTLEDVGGYMYVMDLTDSVPSISNINQYIEMVKSAAVKRDVIRMSYELLDMAYDPMYTAEQILETAESSIFSLSQDRYSQDLDSMEDAFSKKELELLGYIENGGITEDQKKERVNTGISDLDNMIDGLTPGELIILAARPAMGKTSMVMGLATSIALSQNLPCPIFSLEMLRDRLAERIISSEFGKNMYEFKGGRVSRSEIDKLKDVLSKLKAAPLYIHDQGALTTKDIRNKVRKLKVKNKKMGPVIIDYLQLCNGLGKNRTEEVSKIARDLKDIALELQVTIIALSQLSREVETRAIKIPQLSDLRDSGEIEQAADIVMFIYREEYYKPETSRTKEADLIIAKNRNGPVGDVTLFFDSALTKFSGLEK